MKTFGVALLLLGLVGVVFGGFEYDRQRTVLQIGAMSTTVTENPVQAMVPVAGLVSLAGGVVVLLLTQKKRRA